MIGPGMHPAGLVAVSDRRRRPYRVKATTELPLVFLGRITVAHDQMSVDEINALEQEAFRFSGVGALKC